jgi:tetratricopeptide (TPR) repeat protein
MMKKFLLACLLCCMWSGAAWAHSDIEGLPDSVAIMAYKQVLYLNPGDLATRNELAMAHCRRGNLADAKEELQIVLKKEARNFDALDGMGVVLLKTGQYKEALTYLEKAVKVNDKDPMVYVHLSAAFHKLKMSDKAKTHWKKAQSLVSTRAERNKLKQELQWVAGK